MRFNLCVAWDLIDELQHHHLVPVAKAARLAKASQRSPSAGVRV